MAEEQAGSSESIRKEEQEASLPRPAIVPADGKESQPPPFDPGGNWYLFVAGG